MGKTGLQSPASSKKGTSGVGTSELAYFPPVGDRQDAAVYVDQCTWKPPFLTVLVLIHLLPPLATGLLRKVDLGLGDELSKAFAGQA